MESSKQELLAEIADLKARLEEAEETLEALRSGAVDALVVSSPEGEQVFTLKGADHTYRHLVENISEGAATLTSEGDILYANGRLGEVLRLPLERVIGSSLREYIAAADQDLFEALFSQARNGGSKGEVPLKAGDGFSVPAYLSFSSLHLKDAPGALSLVVTDLTQQKLQEALVADGKLSQEILGQAEQPIAVCDRSGRIIRASRGLQELCGQNPLLLPFHHVFPLKLSSGRTFLLAPLFQGQTLRNVEASLRRPGEGRQIHLLLNAGPLLAEDLEVKGFVMALTDITERQQAATEKLELLEKLQINDEELRVQMEELQIQTEELQAANQDILTGHKALKESEERYRALMQTANDAIVLADVETGEVLEINEKTALLVGRPRSEIIGRHFTCLHPPAEESFYRQAFQEYVRRGNGTVTEIFYIQSQDDRQIPVEISGSITELGGRKVAWGIFRDLTERLRMEEEKSRLEAELFQAQKLEAIGTLAGGIAHDFNNILWAIMGYTEMTLMSLPENSPERFNLEQVMQAGGRARDLVNQILAFSRTSIKAREPLRPSLIIKEALKLLRATLPTTIEIRSDIKSPDAMVLADATQLHQVLMNLCTNAAHALQETGGIMEVGLEEVIVDSANPAQDPALIPGAYAALTVSDTGPGMEPAILSRIFEPFFTTKGVGEGTGMGLSVVHGIVKSYGGEITVTSQMGRGSTFRVFLPMVKGEEKPAPVVCSPLPTGTGRILCVDDEPMLVDLLKAELGRLGYDVTARNSSVEALELFQAHPEQFDLVITDQTMPHLTGMQLAHELRRLRPDVPIIICTGYSDKVSEEKIEQAGIKKMLMKPVDLRQLVEVVRGVLDAREGER
jgi:PAS domain S-box-containing protein